jgi:mannose-6-phosphate isomerase-like protein (cupin superfamily)
MSEASGFFLARSSEQPVQPSRRPGIQQKRLLPPTVAPEQNWLIFSYTAGAVVELHPVVDSEVLFVLSGRFLATSNDGQVELGPGDLIYFPPGYAHGFRCLDAGDCLAVFAPARQPSSE